MNKTLTVEEYINAHSDEELLDIALEITKAVIPATGAAHMKLRRINQKIDQGKLCISPTTYRKMYMPTFAKIVLKVFASRHVEYLLKQKAPAPWPYDNMSIYSYLAAKKAGEVQ